MEDRRPIDFDKYRAIAAQERALAINLAIDHLVAWVAYLAPGKAPRAPRASEKQPPQASGGLLQTSTKPR